MTLVKNRAHLHVQAVKAMPQTAPPGEKSCGERRRCAWPCGEQASTTRALERITPASRNPISRLDHSLWAVGGVFHLCTGLALVVFSPSKSSKFATPLSQHCGSSMFLSSPATDFFRHLSKGESTRLRLDASRVFVEGERQESRTEGLKLTRHLQASLWRHVQDGPNSAISMLKSPQPRSSIYYSVTIIS